MEESRTYLQTDGKNEEDESEVLDERQHHGIDPQTQMPKQDAHKQNPRTPKRNTLDLELAQEKARSNDNGQNQNGRSGVSPCKKIQHGM